MIIGYAPASRKLHHMSFDNQVRVLVVKRLGDMAIPAHRLISGHRIFDSRNRNIRPFDGDAFRSEQSRLVLEQIYFLKPPLAKNALLATIPLGKHATH